MYHKLLNLDYITYNDGFVINSDNGFGSILNVFKFKNILIFYNVAKNENMSGKINYRILKIFKKLNLL